MSVLRSIEEKIEGLVERAFGRVFRSGLQPVELARKLAREMEAHKTVSVSRVYVPNEYTVFLSPADRESFSSYETSLVQELCSYLSAHAKGEGLSLLADPRVLLETDADLHIGEFGIACRMVDPQPEPPAEPADEDEEEPEAEPEPSPVGEPQAAAEVEAPPAPVPPPAPAPPPAPVPAPVMNPPTRINEALAGVSGTQVLSPEEARAAGLGEPEIMWLVFAGKRHRLSLRVTKIGRSRDCDVVVPDPNVSRVHAEVRHIGLDYFLVDMGSTNGIEVNGQSVKRHALADGDTVIMGTTEIPVERT